MSKVYTEFGLGQTVWFLKGIKAVKAKVRAIEAWDVPHNENKNRYNLDGYGWYAVQYLYPNKKSLCKGLFNEQ